MQYKTKQKPAFDLSIWILVRYLDWTDGTKDGEY